MHDPILTLQYPHSGLCRKVRAEVHESELRLQAQLAYMATFGSLHAHAQADLEKGAAIANSMFFDALASVPFLTGGKKGNEVEQDDRMDAIKAYRAYEDRILKPKDKD